MYEGNLTYDRAIETAEHRIALGQTRVYVTNADGFPFDKVTRISSGSSFRLNIPTNLDLGFSEGGLDFTYSFDIEPSSANGKGTHRIDRGAVRDLAARLSPEARGALAAYLKGKVLPNVEERAAEIMASYTAQRDALDCLRGVIHDTENSQ